MRPSAPLLLTSAALLLAACASNPAPYPDYPVFIPLSVETADYIRLAEGPCAGACPVYELTLHSEGQYVLFGSRFTEGADRSDNRPAEDSLERAKDILLRAGFDDMPEDITPENPDLCPGPETGRATAEIMIGREDGYYRIVRYDQGCFHDMAETMLRQLRATMRIADLVRPAD